MALSNIRNIFLIGPMGAGKSTIGKQIAKELGLDFYDSDSEVEKRCGADISWIFDIEGEQGFRKREADVIDQLSQLQNIVLATGGGAVITPENRTVLGSRGTVIFLHTSLEQQYDRTRRDTKRPLLQTDDVEARIQQLWAEREPFYRELADFTFDTEALSIKAMANHIIKKLQESCLSSR